MTISQDDGKFFSLTNQPHLPPGNSPSTNFCYRLRSVPEVSRKLSDRILFIKICLYMYIVKIHDVESKINKTVCK
jgi:hypothetical protein